MGDHDLWPLPHHRARCSGPPLCADVKEGDLWYFPAGLPHSLQGLGPDGAEFVLAFDNGASSEFNTLPATDWMAHTPPDVLAKNFGVPAEAFKNIPLQNRWIFQGKVPAPLAEAQEAMASKAGAPEFPFTFSLADAPPSLPRTQRVCADRGQHELSRFRRRSRPAW